MRKILTLSFCFLVVAATYLFCAEPETLQMTGWVSDSSCGAEHTKAGGKDCVEKCIRGGAHIGHPEWKPQARVFVDDKDKKVHTVKNQDALKGYEGEHIRVIARQERNMDGLEIVEVARLDEEK